MIPVLAVVSAVFLGSCAGPGPAGETLRNADIRFVKERFQGENGIIPRTTIKLLLDLCGKQKNDCV